MASLKENFVPEQFRLIRKNQSTAVMRCHAVGMDRALPIRIVSGSGRPHVDVILAFQITLMIVDQTPFLPGVSEYATGCPPLG
jgi:hypothetical protein